MKKLAFCFLLFIFGLTSCTKEEGPAGPQGPQGPAGNANVKVVTMNNQAIEEHPLLPGIYLVTLDIDEITSSVMSNGSVQVFLGEANSNNISWTAVPGNFSPDFGVIPTLYYDVQTVSGTVVIYTNSQPPYPAVDAKVVITAGS